MSELGQCLDDFNENTSTSKAYLKALFGKFTVS